MTAKKYSVYLANAMTNIPAFNFPWFFEAEEWLIANTHVTDVKNPARKDLEAIPLDVMVTIPGYDTGDLPTYVANSSFTMANAMEWDLPAILKSNGIVLGDKWPTSTGARYERLVAEALDRDIWLLHGDGHETPFELERDEDKAQLTTFLRGFGAPAAIEAPQHEEDEPDTSRSPTEADRLLAGTLSTIWPMSSRHPADCLHLAIYLNDHDQQLGVALTPRQLLGELDSRLGHIAQFREPLAKIEANLA